MVKIHECNIGDKVTMALKFQNLQIKKTTSNADYASIVGFDSVDLINAISIIKRTYRFIGIFRYVILRFFKFNIYLFTCLY